MSRHAAHSFALHPTRAQRQGLAQHCGAARMAYNIGLAAWREALAKRKGDPSVKVPSSGFDFINGFNAWKRSPAAGQGAADGAPGLAWRRSVSQQVFEEASVDLGRAVAAYRRVKGRGAPAFKSKGRDAPHCRFRNKQDCVRVEPGQVVLPKLGAIRLRGCTRNVRRLLRERPDRPGAQLLFATVSCRGGRWFVHLNLACHDIDPRQQTQGSADALVGVDLGLTAFAVIADAAGREHGRALAPKPLAAHQRRLRRLNRALHRRKRGSRRRRRARGRLARAHQRIACIRRDALDKLSTQLTHRYGQIALEDLNVAGMVRNHCLARHIQDSGWASFARMVTYKGAWYGCAVHRVDRFAPTTKRCCRGTHGDAAAAALRAGVHLPGLSRQAGPRHQRGGQLRPLGAAHLA